MNSFLKCIGKDGILKKTIKNFVGSQYMINKKLILSQLQTIYVGLNKRECSVEGKRLLILPLFYSLSQ